MRAAGRQRGVVLLIVLFFALLLSASIATFLKRATVDALLARNRDAMARAEALARGGVQLAEALLIEDEANDEASEAASALDTGLDAWSRIGQTTIETRAGATLHLQIDDAGARLNLNALFRFDPDAEEGVPDRTEAFLLAFLEKMIDELPLEQRARYDARELTDNLIDYVDADDVRRAGGLENDYYQSQTPPYRAANRPLLSVEEIGLIEGFDADLLDVIRPYVTVHPFAGGAGVNPNTAPPHILALIFYNDGVDLRFVQEDEVRKILEVRDEGRIFCPNEGQSDEACTPMSEIVPNSESIHPPLSYHSDVFAVRSEASVGGVQRTVEAVIDRTVLEEPQVLSWRVW